MKTFPDFIQAVLTDESQEKLASVLDGGMFPNKYMHHVTLAYKPDQSTYKKVVFGNNDSVSLNDGDPVVVKIGKYVFDEEYGLDVVTARVVTTTGEDIYCDNVHCHITVSTTDERKPVDSNKLLNRAAIHKSEDVPLDLEGSILFGYFSKKK